MANFKIFKFLASAVVMGLFLNPVFGQNRAFHQIIQSRRSIRHFLPRAIPEELLKIFLESAAYAPSAMNRQPWKFILVKKTETRQKVLENIFWLAEDKPIPGEAPVAYVIFLSESNEPERLIDCSFAVSNLINSAWAEGVGSCVLGSFREEVLKKILKIPPNKKIFVIVALGYPVPGKIPQVVPVKKDYRPYDQNGLKIPKKSLKDILFLDEYGRRP